MDEVFPPQRDNIISKGDEGYALGSELDAAKKIAQLPASMQAKYNNLPKAAQRILTK